MSKFLDHLRLSNAGVSFLSIVFGAGGATEKIEFGASGTCKNALRAQRNTAPDTSSSAPEAPAKTRKKSRIQTLSASVSFLSIEFGTGGTSNKQKLVWHQRNRKTD